MFEVEKIHLWMVPYKMTDTLYLLPQLLFTLKLYQQQIYLPNNKMMDSKIYIKNDIYSLSLIK